MLFTHNRHIVWGYVDFIAPKTSTGNGIVHRWEVPPRGSSWVLRDPQYLYDPYRGSLIALAEVPKKLVDELGLRAGDFVQATVSQGAVKRILNPPPQNRTSWRDPHDARVRFPTKKFDLGAGGDLAMRALDLLAPIGPGQRAVIVSPPQSGKTTVIRFLAEIFTTLLKQGQIDKLFVVLVGERPEDVSKVCAGLETEDEQKISIWATHFDTPFEWQVVSAELALAAAEREGERGNHVVVLVDSLTGLISAYDNCLTDVGQRTLPGGIERVMLWALRDYLSGARFKDGGGSVAILATQLLAIARTDPVIQEYLHGVTTSLWEFLARGARPPGLPYEFFPLPDLQATSTREQEAMFGSTEEWQIEARRALRELLANTNAPYQRLVGLLSSYEDNEELLRAVWRMRKREEFDDLHQKVIDLSGKLRRVPEAAKLILDALLSGPLGWGRINGIRRLIHLLRPDESPELWGLLKKDGILRGANSHEGMPEEAVDEHAPEESETEALSALLGIPDEMLQ